MANGTFVAIDEAKLWSMADALRNNMDAAEYKHVVLGLIFWINLGAQLFLYSTELNLVVAGREWPRSFRTAPSPAITRIF